MKKNLSILIILMAFATVLFMGCANGSKDSNNSSDGGSSTTAVSGKVYGGYLSGVLCTLSFAETGNSIIVSEDGIPATGTYSMSGSSLTVIVNGYTMNMTYNSTSDTITYSGQTFTRA